MFSFEFLPPKTDEARRTLEVLKDDRPDDVSVTYGAGGTTGVRRVVQNPAANPIRADSRHDRDSATSDR